MKISFTGTGSTGKSTLLKLCKERYGDKFNYIEEVTRLVKRTSGLPINEEAGDETQVAIMAQHCANAEAYGPTENVIMDRCAIDGAIYSLWLARNGKVSPYCAMLACEIADKLIADLDIVFFCKPDFDLVKDGERSDNDDFRLGVNELFEQILFSTELPDFANKNMQTIVLSGPIEERMKKIEETLSKYDIYPN